jgi:hypothetical protein
MMKWFDINPRALPLLLGLMLIGGTACFSMQAPSPDELARIQAQQREQQRLQLEKLQRDADTGNIVAITNLAHVYLHGSFGVARDTTKATALLEKAAAASYAPAQAELGWILLDGRINRNGNPVESLQALHDPGRGMALLKASLAGTTCVYHAGPQPAQAQMYFRTGAEYDISDIYRSGKLVPQDMEQANLWLGRSLVHCQFPTAILLETSPHYGISMGPIPKLAWLMLLPPSPQLDAARSAASPEELQVAQQESARLREAVVQSEAQYPAPH